MKLKDIWEKVKSKIMGKESCCEMPEVEKMPEVNMPEVENKIIVKKKAKKKKDWESTRKTAVKRKR
jgi:hypothetical protein